MTISSNRVWPRAGFIGVLAVSLVFLAGCGKSKKEGTVSGKVTYPTADKPVTGGTIRLFPAEGTGEMFTVTINADGTFSTKGVPSGEKKVVIETETIRGATGGNPYESQMKGMKPPGGAEVKVPQMDTSKMPKYVKIPPIYGKPETTPLRWTIVDGPNTKEFNLTASGK